MATTLTRRNPLLDLSELRGMIDPIFSDVEAQLGFSQNWMPAIDVIRNESEVKIHVEVPGIKPDDVKIEVENETLTVSGEVEEQIDKTEGKYMRRERRYGSFSRSIALPPKVDRDAIDAVCKDGVLEVTIPLPQQDAGGKTEIKAKSG